MCFKRSFYSSKFHMGFSKVPYPLLYLLSNPQHHLTLLVPISYPLPTLWDHQGRGDRKIQKWWMQRNCAFQTRQHGCTHELSGYNCMHKTCRRSIQSKDHHGERRNSRSPTPSRGVRGVFSSGWLMEEGEPGFTRNAVSERLPMLQWLSYTHAHLWCDIRIGRIQWGGA